MATLGNAGIGPIRLKKPDQAETKKGGEKVGAQLSPVQSLPRGVAGHLFPPPGMRPAGRLLHS